MPALFALSTIGVFCLVGMLLRRWIPVLRNNLVPATVVAGVLGAVAMNLGLQNLVDGMDAEMFTVITTQLFTLAFISIGLAKTPKSPATDDSDEESPTRSSGLLRGAWAMGITWTIAFTAQALVAVGTIAVAGVGTDMDPMYGLLAAFAFAQGPGQAATFGVIFEKAGWVDAVPVALAFSASGFIAAFLVGVPLAKLGIRRGLARAAVPLSESVHRGVLPRDEQRESMGRVTTFSGSIETLAFHAALMGVAYLLAHGIAWVFALLPGFLGTTLSGLMFLNGLYGAYIVRWVLGLLKLDHLLSNELQGHIAGVTSDLLVVSAFMAVQAAVVAAWIVPILGVFLAVTVLTLLITMGIGQRYGSDHDFERAIGMYGTTMGTTPTGLALVRILDPRMRTATLPEMGLMNLPEMTYIPAMLAISAFFAGSLSGDLTLAALGGLLVGYVVLLLATRGIGRRTWSFSTRWMTKHRPGDDDSESRLTGELNTDPA